MQKLLKTESEVELLREICTKLQLEILASLHSLLEQVESTNILVQ